MEIYQKCLDRIEELKNTKFDYHQTNIHYQDVYSTFLLRKALLAYNYITKINDSEVRLNLQQQVDTIMQEKFKSLNPNLDLSTLSVMCDYYKRDIYQFPLDLFVVGDVVFSKEMEFNDFGKPDKIKTFMFENNGKYFNVINQIMFNKVESIFEYVEKGIVDLSDEDTKDLCIFISNNINAALFPRFNRLATRPLFEIKGYEHSEGLAVCEILKIAIYLDKHYKDIVRSILNKEECDIRMIVQKEDDITMYNFHQMFVNNELVWDCQLIDEPVWKLSEAAIAYENNLTGPNRKLEDKNDYK